MTDSTTPENNPPNPGHQPTGAESTPQPTAWGPPQYAPAPTPPTWASSEHVGAAPNMPPPPAGELAPNPVGYGYGYPPAQLGQIGKIRGTGTCILLTIVTLGIYSLFWWYQVHDEMKRHSGQGIGGGIALLLAFFVGFVTPFLTSSEIGNLYAARGMRKPVSGATGLWYFPGVFILVGPLIWFIQTNGAINAYWRSLGATA